MENPRTHEALKKKAIAMSNILKDKGYKAVAIEIRSLVDRLDVAARLAVGGDADRSEHWKGVENQIMATLERKINVTKETRS